MATYPFNNEGVQEKQKELYSLSDDELFAQAKVIAADGRAWVFDNFELTEAQTDYYNSLPDDFNLFLGYQLAAQVVGRQEIDVQDPPEEVSKSSNSKKGTDVSVGGEATYDPTTGNKNYTIKATITWHF